MLDQPFGAEPGEAAAAGPERGPSSPAVGPVTFEWRGLLLFGGLVHRFPLGAAPCVVDAGPMDVIDLEQRRREREEPPAEYAACQCGEAWFELRGGPTGNGAVCMTRDGTITGYAGTPWCVSCGEPVTLRSTAT